jgi:hypothetical protein
MPAPLRLKLSELEKETLGELHKANTVPYRTRNRAQMLKLNAQGINVPEIAQIRKKLYQSDGLVSQKSSI